MVRPVPLDDGTVVEIELDDFGTRIDLRLSDGQVIGRVELQDLDGSYLLRWMYLDLAGQRFTRRGLGRAALAFHKEVFGSPLVARGHDGLRRDDGSHLTADAPAFIAKMRDEGVVAPADDDRD